MLKDSLGGITSQDNHGETEKGVEIMVEEIGVPQAIRDAVQTAGEENKYGILMIFDYDKEYQVLTLDGEDMDLVDPIAVNGVENALEARDDVRRVEWNIPREF